MNKEEFINSNMKLSKEDIIEDYYKTEEKLGKYLGIEHENYELKQENKRLKDNWNEIKGIIEDMIYVGYVDNNTTCYWATERNSEFGTRAKVILNKMTELEQGSDNQWLGKNMQN